MLFKLFYKIFLFKALLLILTEVKVNSLLVILDILILKYPSTQRSHHFDIFPSISFIFPFLGAYILRK